MTIQNSGALTKYSQKELLPHFLPTVFNLEKTEKIPLAIRSFLLSEQLVFTAFGLLPTDNYFDYTINNLDKLPEADRSNLARLAAQIAMFKGDWALVGKLSRYFDDVNSAVFLG